MVAVSSARTPVDSGRVPENDTNRATQRLDALLHLARVSREAPLEVVLETVADVVERVVGFTTVVFNMYRPAYDDYLVVQVHGPQDSRDALMGTSSSREVWLNDILRPEVEVVPGAFLMLAENDAAWARVGTVWTPAIEPVPDLPNQWNADDGLFVELRASHGLVLGILSLDSPISRQRPTRDDLEMVVAVANHAAIALESAQDAAENAKQRQTLTNLLDVSFRLSAATTIDGVIDQICTSAIPDLGFEALSIYLADDGQLIRAAGRGDAGASSTIDPDRVQNLLRRHDEQVCVLVDRIEIVPRDPASSLSGIGPAAWNDQRLLVAMRRRDGELIGVLMFDNPTDRLRPDTYRRQTLRLLADHAASAMESIERQSNLSYLASHDPLTGVRNRRDLRAAIDAFAAEPEGVSILICDLDHFKAINDKYGHDLGDQLLQRFGAILREHSREDDIPARIGGEEFCLVLARTGRREAFGIAERLRRATEIAMGELVPGGLTVSIGAASCVPPVGSAATLMACADEALYAAKAAGRNRCQAAA
jgi:diguanylate cyclase (GGDEF)-like protein